MSTISERPSHFVREFFSAPREETPLDWMADGLCTQTDPELFFPDVGGSAKDAKRVCAGCGVRARCLAYALENGFRWGIWGGLSERERRPLARGSFGRQPDWSKL